MAFRWLVCGAAPFAAQHTRCRTCPLHQFCRLSKSIMSTTYRYSDREAGSEFRRLNFKLTYTGASRRQAGLKWQNKPFAWCSSPCRSQIASRALNTDTKHLLVSTQSSVTILGVHTISSIRAPQISCVQDLVDTGAQEAGGVVHAFSEPHAVLPFQLRPWQLP